MILYNVYFSPPPPAKTLLLDCSHVPTEHDGTCMLSAMKTTAGRKNAVNLLPWIKTSERFKVLRGFETHSNVSLNALVNRTSFRRLVFFLYPSFIHIPCYADVTRWL